MNIDLDAAKAARMEEEHEAKTVTLGGQQFDLPVELPFKVADLWRIGEIAKGLELALGDQWEAFDALMPSTLDLQELVRNVALAYGFGGLGESNGSGSSSTNGGRRSKRTS